MLRAHLPLVIRVKGRDFFPQDGSLQEYFKDLKFDLADTLRLLGDPEAPLFIANKMDVMKEIKGFQGEYRFLSNFHPSPVVPDGLTFGRAPHVAPVVEVRREDDQRRV